MKNIYLALGAALVATAASAAAPVIPQVKRGQVSPVSAQMMQTVKAQNPAMAVKSIQTVRPGHWVMPLNDEETTETTFGARYRDPINMFYLGLTPSASGMSVGLGLAGASGNLGYLNTTADAASNSWAYTASLNSGDELAETAETANLLIPGRPYQLMLGGLWSKTDGAPVLTSTNASAETAEYTTENTSLGIAFGGSLLSYGIKPSALWSDWDASDTENDYFLMSTCPVPPYKGGQTYVDYLSKVMGAEGANENGVNGDLVSIMPQVLFDSPENYSLSDLKITGYTAMIPEMMSGYTMGQIMARVLIATDDAVELTVTVYPVNEEGEVETSKPLGQGTCQVEAGAVATNITDLKFNLESLDSEGFATEEPLVVTGMAVATISGIDNEHITAFQPIYNAGTTMPADATTSQYFPVKAYIEIAGNVTDLTQEGSEAQPFETMISSPWRFYEDQTYTTLWSASEYFWFFDVVFPFVSSADWNNSPLDVNVPATGGEGSVQLVSYYDVPALIEAGLMTVEPSADWFTWSAEYKVYGEGDSQDEALFVTVTADALPEGVTGREATIKFTGYASDFTVNVLQGESGITEIQGAAKGAAYYDLQGRQLRQAPAAGLYIERQGNTATKRIAK